MVGGVGLFEWIVQVAKSAAPLLHSCCCCCCTTTKSSPSRPLAPCPHLSLLALSLLTLLMTSTQGTSTKVTTVSRQLAANINTSTITACQQRGGGKEAGRTVQQRCVDVMMAHEPAAMTSVMEQDTHSCFAQPRKYSRKAPLCTCKAGCTRRCPPGPSFALVTWSPPPSAACTPLCSTPPPQHTLTCVALRTSTLRLRLMASDTVVVSLDRRLLISPVHTTTTTTHMEHCYTYVHLHMHMHTKHTQTAR